MESVSSEETERVKVPRLSLEKGNLDSLVTILSSRGSTTSRKSTRSYSPLNRNSPHTPGTPKSNLKAIKEAIPKFLDKRGIPWLVNNILERLTTAIEEEEGQKKYDQLATALGRELCIIETGGALALTAKSEEEVFTLIATRGQLKLDEIEWTLPELKKLARRTKSKVNSARVKKKSGWKSISFLNGNYWVETDQLKKLCDHWDILPPEQSLSLHPTKTWGLFEITCDDVTIQKRLSLYCDLPSLVEAWWGGLSEGYCSSNLSLTPSLSEEINNIEGLLKKVRSEKPSTYMSNWPHLLSSILREWDRLKLADDLATLPILKIDTETWICRRLKPATFISKPPPPLWCVAQGQAVLEALVEKHESSVCISIGEAQSRHLTIASVKELWSKYEFPFKRVDFKREEIKQFVVEMENDQVAVFLIDIVEEAAKRMLGVQEQKQESRKLALKWVRLYSDLPEEGCMRLFWEPESKLLEIEYPEEIE